MDAPTAHADLFFHVRIIIAIVTGLSVTRLLTGLARFIQHPGQERIYFVHLGWVLFLLLAVIHFWWFEFGLSRVDRWTFEIYFFILCYAILFFVICVILFPDRMDDYSGYADYFHSRQKWFYGLLGGLFLIDLVDTALKGAAHFHALGAYYPARQGILFGLAVAAMFVAGRRYHAVFVAAALLAQVIWILSEFDVLT